MDASTIQLLGVFAPLGGVMLGGLITWRGGIRAQALARLAESRANLVGAMEESISATTAFRDDLTNWQLGGWANKTSQEDPRTVVLTTQVGIFKKAMSESRGHVAAAHARLLALSDSREDMHEATALTEAVLAYGAPGSDAEWELAAKAKALRQRTRALAEGWRKGRKQPPARPSQRDLESAEPRSAPTALVGDD